MIYASFWTSGIGALSLFVALGGVLVMMAVWAADVTRKAVPITEKATVRQRGGNDRNQRRGR